MVTIEKRLDDIEKNTQPEKTILALYPVEGEPGKYTANGQTYTRDDFPRLRKKNFLFLIEYEKPSIDIDVFNKQYK